MLVGTPLVVLFALYSELNMDARIWPDPTENTFERLLKLSDGVRVVKRVPICLNAAVFSKSQAMLQRQLLVDSRL